MRKHAGCVVLAFLLVFGAWACGSDDSSGPKGVGEDCATSPECEKGLECVSGKCQVPLTGDNDEHDAAENESDTTEVDHDAIENENELVEGDAESVDGDPDTEILAEADTEIEPEADTEVEAELENEADAETQPLTPALFWDYLVTQCPWDAACDGGQLNTCLGNLDGECNGQCSNTNSTYLDFLANRLEAAQTLVCLKSVKTCSEYLACINHVVPGERCSASVESYCQGTVKVSCGLSYYDGGVKKTVAEALDCGQRGTGCQEGKTGQITTARCVAPSCASGSTHCDGNTVTACQSSPFNDYVNDCSLSGAVCARRCKDGSATCADADSYVGCTDASTEVCHPGCDGSILRECVPESTRWRAPHDCKLIHPDYTCSMTKLGTTYAEVPACQVEVAKRECSTYNVITCDGTKAHFCLSGKKLDIDCAPYGMICDTLVGCRLPNVKR